MRKRVIQVSARTSLFYWIISTLWILLSDRVLLMVVSDDETSHQIQTYKGWFFVTVTAILLYGVLRSQLLRWEKEVNERKRAEDALRENQHNFQQLAESLPQLVWTCDADGKNIYAGPQWAAYTGVPITAQTNDSLYSLIHPEDQQRVQDAWREVYASGKNFKTEMRIRHHDGSYRWFDVRALPLRDKTGHILKWVGTNTDIQEQREMREALRAAEERLRLATEAAQIGTWERHLKSNQLIWSPLQERIMGYEPGTFPNTYEAFFALVHPEDQQRLKEAQQKALQTGMYRAELRFKTADGRERWGLLRGRILYDKTGQPERIIGIDMDITERKRDEEALRQSERLFRIVFNQQFQYLLLLTPDGRVRAVNDLALRVAGAQRDDFLGKFLWQTPGWETLAERQAVWPHRLLEAKEKNGSVLTEDAYQLPDGRIGYTDTAVTAVRKEDGEVEFFIVQANDTTKRKNAEIALQRSEERLRRLHYIVANVALSQREKIQRLLELGVQEFGLETGLLASVEGEHLNVTQAFSLDNSLSAGVQFHLSDALCEEAMRRPDILAIEHVAATPWREHKAYTQLGTEAYFGIPVQATNRAYGVVCFASKVPRATSFTSGDYEFLRLLAQWIGAELTQHEAEEKLRQSENHFRALFEAGGVGSVECEAETGRFLRVNQKMCEIVGYSAKELQERTFAEITHPADRDLTNSQFQQFITGQIPEYEVEKRYVRKDGSIVWVGVTSSLLRDQEGRPWHTVAVIQDITKRKQTEAELEKSLEEIRSLALHLQEVREEERKRIARELHDELGQALAGLKFDLAWLENQLSPLDATAARACREKTQTMSKLIDTTIQIGRQIATELRPRVLDDLGLIAALRWQARDFQTRTGITCQFLTSLDDLPLDAGRATAAFRICQETLTNVLKHAQATAVTIRARVENNFLALEINDNGRGITKQQSTGAVSLGLLGMKERVLPYGGTIDIQGQAGKGTTIRVVLPLTTD